MLDIPIGPDVTFKLGNRFAKLENKNRKLTKCGHLEDKTLAVVSLILSLL
jgi:hypothetical protein